MKLFSTRTHGILDFISVGTLLALPRLFGWSKQTTSLLTNIALGTFIASLLTRYEFGLFKVLPMKGHLLMDVLVSLVLIASPFVFGFADEGSHWVFFVVLGVGYLLATLMTQEHPADDPARRDGGARPAAAA